MRSMSTAGPLPPTPPLPHCFKYLQLNRIRASSFGLAELRSPSFIAVPGDRISFSFWIHSHRAQFNNLQVIIWLINIMHDRTWYIGRTTNNNRLVKSELLIMIYFYAVQQISYIFICSSNASFVIRCATFELQLGVLGWW